MLFKQPLEIKLQITQKCNYNCSFCFSKGFSQGKELSTRQLKGIIRKIASEGIEKVRFTGGEPLLRKDLPELLQFAKAQNLFVMLNSNGTCFTKASLAAASKHCDDALISFNSISASAESLLHKSPKNLFEKKIMAIKALAAANVFTRPATVLHTNNIALLQEFSNAIDGLPASQWVLLRPIPTSYTPMPVTRAAFSNAIEKILSINKGKTAPNLIENAVPFCAYYPEKVSRACIGAINEDGNSKLVVDAVGTIKPSYFLGIPLGSALNASFSDAWNSDFMHRLHSLEFIAEQCHKCRHLHKCRGGSRYAALFAKSSLYALDPLSDPRFFGS